MTMDIVGSSVRDVYSDSKMSFIFELLKVNSILKLCILSDSPRKFYFEHVEKKTITATEFNREKDVQQIIYGLPYGHFCPQIYQAGILEQGSDMFLQSIQGTTHKSRTMLQNLLENLSGDSIGYILMEYIPPSYIPLHEYTPSHTTQEIENKCLHAMARLMVIFIMTLICNTDAHLGNIMVKKEGASVDEVILIDFGGAVHAETYEPYSLVEPQSNFVKASHIHAKMTNKYSTRYELHKYNIHELNIDILFNAIREYVIIDYECNPKEIACKGLLNILFPHIDTDITRDSPDDFLFSDDWFGKTKCMKNLKRILAIIETYKDIPYQRVEPESAPPMSAHPAPPAPPAPPAHPAPPAPPAPPTSPTPASLALQSKLVDTRPEEWPPQHKPPKTMRLQFDGINTFIVGCAVAVLAGLYFGRTRKHKKHKLLSPSKRRLKRVAQLGIKRVEGSHIGKSWMVLVQK
jgi:hypothetical protein